MSKKKSEDLKIGNVPPFGLRMMPDLRDQLERAALQNKRSLNAEIIARLSKSLEEPTTFRTQIVSQERIEDLIEKVVRRVQSQPKSDDNSE